MVFYYAIHLICQQLSVCGDMLYWQVLKESACVLTGHSSLALRDGASYVYPMWRQLLNKWFSTDGCKVYVCSKHVDVSRFKDLSGMGYKVKIKYVEMCQK